MWRLMPFLFLLYIVAYLDRINMSFAVLQMRGQLGLSERVIGRAGGMFFIGYSLFQLPSNLVVEKFGVRRWISILMIGWGVISCSMVFVRGPLSFYAVRFLLGAAEAGFFPGMILYMKRWFPASGRARAFAWFMTANALAGVVGSPVSGALLGLQGGGLSGWQWMFLLEGLPAIVLGSVVFATLTESPRDAKWLQGEERIWLLQKLESERQAGPAVSQGDFWKVLVSGRVWLLSIVYFGVSATMYGISLWLPSVIQALSGMGYFWTSMVTILPYLVTVGVMVLVGMLSDRRAERRWHTAIPAFTAAAGLVLAGYGGHSTFVVVTGIGVGMAFAEGMCGPFWAMATSRMEGLSAAAGIAVVNSLANLGGFFGPTIIGFFRYSNGGFRGGMLAIAAVLVISGTVALIVGADHAVRPAHS
jgi:MFS transporter, ACS family, tartrate transporter